MQNVDSFVIKAPLGPGSRPIFAERMTSIATLNSGDLAQVWARYDAELGDSTHLERWKGVDAFTLLKHQGRWKIVALAFAGDR